MQFIDTHAHLYQTEFENDLDNILLNCKNNGIEQVLIPNVDAESWPLMLDLHNKYPSQIKMMLGIHPCYVQENYSELLNKMMIDFDAQKYVAIGEIGIDLYWDNRRKAYMNLGPYSLMSMDKKQVNKYFDGHVFLQRSKKGEEYN